MADSFSIKAILSAADRGFTSTMKAASGYVDNLKSTLTSGIGFGVMMAAGQAAFNTISNSVTGLVGDLNSSSAAWKTFQGNMEMTGKSADQIKAVKGELQDFAEATIYSSSDMASTFAQLEAVGTKNTTKLVKGFGGLAAAAENPTQAMKTLSQQATQMAAKPTVAWEDFKLILEQTPAGVAAVAKQMGKSTQGLIKDVQAGTVATEDFFDAIATVGTNDAFTKLATEYKTVDQAMDGLQETMSNKLQPAFDVLSAKGISAISKLVDKVGELDGEKIAAKLTSGLDKIKPYWDVLVATASEMGSAFGDAFSAISKELAELNGSFGSTESVEGFGDAIGVAGDALKTFAGFLEDHADTVAVLIDNLPKLLMAYMAFKLVKAVAPPVTAFGKAIIGLAGSGIKGLAGKLFGVSKGQEAVGKSSSGSSKKILSSAKAFMMLGAGVALISSGFYLLAQSAVDLSDAGGPAIAVMFGLVAAVAALGAGMTVMMKSIKTSPAKLKALSTAMLSLGAAVLMISAGFAVLAQSSIALANAGAPAIATMLGMVVAVGALMVVASMIGKQLTAASVGMVAFGAAVLIAGAGMYVMSAAAISLVNAGTPAIAVMAGMVVAMAGLMVLAAVLGPALTAGAVGMLAFGIAVALVGTGALLASASLAIVAAILPVVVQYGAQGAVAIAALGAGMLVFAAGAAVAGAGSMVLGAGLAVVAAGLALVGAAVIVTAAGVLALAAGAVVLGAGLTLVASSLTVTGAVLPILAAGALASAAAFTVLLAASAAMGAVMLVASAAFAALTLTAAASTLGIAAFALGMTAGSVGVLAMSVALKAVNSSMKSIAKNAKSAQKSLTSMKSSVSVVNEGLDALGNKAKSAINALINQFSNAEGKAKSSGQAVGNNFNSGVSNGMRRAVTTATTMSAAIVAAMRSASGGAYSSGVYIGVGLANGIRSQVGAVRSAAASLASAAEAAIVAKAKIGSPSKITTDLGGFWGVGWVNGILSKVKEAKAATMELISIPSLAPIPEIGMNIQAGVRDLDENYSYTRNAKYTIVVPVEIDGKETARVTAPYTEAELNKQQKVKNMIKGIKG